MTNLRCEDGNVVELSLFNEITRPFSTNEAHLGCSRPSSERHKISPSYFDYIDKTNKNPNLKLKIIFLAPKHRLGDFFFFFSEGHRGSGKDDKAEYQVILTVETGDAQGPDKQAVAQSRRV